MIFRKRRIRRKVLILLLVRERIRRREDILLLVLLDQEFQLEKIFNRSNLNKCLVIRILFIFFLFLWSLVYKILLMKSVGLINLVHLFQLNGVSFIIIY